MSPKNGSPGFVLTSSAIGAGSPGLAAANAQAHATGSYTITGTITASGSAPGLSIGAAGSVAEYQSASSVPHGASATSDVTTLGGNLASSYHNDLYIGFSAGPVSAGLAYSISFGLSDYLL